MQKNKPAITDFHLKKRFNLENNYEGKAKKKKKRKSKTKAQRETCNLTKDQTSKGSLSTPLITLLFVPPNIS